MSEVGRVVSWSRHSDGWTDRTTDRQTDTRYSQLPRTICNVV